MTERVLVAPDKFKGTMTAAEVAERVASGLAAGGFTGEVEALPVADGGEGTVAAAVAAGFRRVELGVRGPTGKPVTASFALRDETAVIEAAQACGLSLLDRGSLAPLTATSRGVGELILTACRMGAKTIAVGVGGVASTDGGAGLVQALGARLTDADGRDLAPGGAALATLETLSLARLRDLSGVDFLLASDVDNPLLGPSGAAAVYGPQKGASAADVRLLETGLARWADVAEAAVAARYPERPAAEIALAASAPGAGAAGGIGFCALLFLGAHPRPGIELLLELAEFRGHVAGARLVITGEGSLDAQSLHGKAPVGVARAAAAHDPAIPVVAVAGRCSLSAADLRAAGIARAYALGDIEPEIERCLADPGPLLERLGAQIAADWLS
jgi:glycerate kinase